LDGPGISYWLAATLGTKGNVSRKLSRKEIDTANLSDAWYAG
jgi:hypothetical protein